MPPCTDLCHALSTLQLPESRLPSHSNLVTQLSLTQSDLDIGRPLGHWTSITQRTHCPFCRLVTAAVRAHALAKGIAAIPPSQPIHVILFPGEQSLRLSYPSRFGIRLAFITEDEARLSEPDTARFVRGTGIRGEVVRGWLRACDEGHAGCRDGVEGVEGVEEGWARSRKGMRASFNERLTSNFRLIDLERGCVCEAMLHERYVALSYVWGSVEMLKLRRGNYDALTSEGGIDALGGELPVTIRDAMELVRGIGERYLWVDALCLIQDDEQDVTIGVTMMNSIYQSSYFTIVAGTGFDANAGLPGVGKTMRDEQRVNTVERLSENIQMAVLSSIDLHLSNSFYNKRGWTFQELVLAKRTLIFINNEVHFRCHSANWSESSWSDKWLHWLDDDDSNITRIPEPHSGVMPSFWAYQKLCEDYTRRTLRNDGDAVSALAGVIRPLAGGMRTDVLEGLPARFLDHFLLFVSTKAGSRRRSLFASYSWAGWEGGISWPRENFIWFEDGGEKRIYDTKNVVRYMKHNRTVQFKALKPTKEYKTPTPTLPELPSKLSDFLKEYPQTFIGEEFQYDTLRITPWHAGETIRHYEHQWDSILDKSNSKELGEATELSFYGTTLMTANGEAEFERMIPKIRDRQDIKIIRNWMASRRFRSEKHAQSIRSFVKSGPYRFRDSALSQEPTVAGLQPGKVDKRTAYATRWNEEYPDDARPVPNFPPYTILAFYTVSINLILGNNNTTSSSHYPQNSLEQTPGIALLSSESIVGSLHPDNIALLPPPGSKIECLVISRCNTPTLGSALLYLPEHDTQRPWTLFWVLYVVWKDGIAERRGVGQILKSAFETRVEPLPAVKHVLLG
ncbi:HET-domain-containing protein [Aaosphaeria arxii CBS 175.79]|uniref:HET-domain-containing protein n=1 Tax=Aaosphaeria arxii CBS 175.79 TaxID=1450172 RepID=A0A6A5YAB4_9PLEO|nr:HET-domain-containing protein [Aaosphaeria arxii CBS 175.79]KAF2022166.1 HET-domain-containing protein [Aaosphaeria arxii CBS 175.79]